MAHYEPEHGSIVHIEYYTNDKPAAQAFYEKAFGWAFEDVEGMDYTMYRAPTPPHGGFFQRSDDFPIQPPPTLPYLNVDNLDETQDAIEDNGGKTLLEQMEIPEMGIFSIFQAPGGVIQAAWEDRYEGEMEGDTELTDEFQPGGVCHFELYTDDPDATQAFYETVFGWSFETIGENEDAYTLANPPTPPRGGVMKSGEHMEPGTLTYLLVEDTNAAVDAIQAADGEILHEPFDIEGWGRMAVFQAPGGIPQALWESTEE